MWYVYSLNHVWLFATPWTVAHQAPWSMRILQARILEWVAMPSSRGNPRPRSLALQAESLPSKSPGKPKNTGVGSLSLLQGTFPSQELIQGLQLCRQILYQLSYHGSLYIYISHIFFIYSSVGGHFHVLAIIYNAAMIIGMHIPYWICIFGR